MAYDYTDDMAFGLEMVTEYGRLVTIQKLAESTSPTNPWEGPGGGSQPIAASHDLPMVFVPPSSASQLGLRTIDEALLKRTQQIIIVAPGPNFLTFLGDYNQVEDDGVLWNILWSETLRPGPVNVLYYFGVRR